MKLAFKIASDRITLNDLIEIEDGKLKSVRGLMIKSLVDDAGNFVPEIKATEIIGNLTLDMFEQAANEIKKAMEAWRASTVPPVGGGK